MRKPSMAAAQLPGGAREQARIVLSAPDRLARLGKTRHLAGRQHGPRRHRRVAMGRVSGRGRHQERHPRQDLIVHPPSCQRLDGAGQGQRLVCEFNPREPGGASPTATTKPCCSTSTVMCRKARARTCSSCKRRQALYAGPGFMPGRHHARLAIMTLAREHGIEIGEKRITRDEMYCADEAFFTGTAAEVTPHSRARQPTASARASAARSRRNCKTRFSRSSSGKNSEVRPLAHQNLISRTRIRSP